MSLWAERRDISLALATASAWCAILGAAMLFTGFCVLRVHGMPRALGGRRLPRDAATPEAARGAAWLDQYSLLALALMLMGAACLIAASIRR